MMRPGTIAGFFGLLGSGKTMMMSRIAYQEWFGGRHVYANYSITFSGPDNGFAIRTYRLSSLADIAGIYNSVVALDELQLTINARRFADDVNIDFAEWVEVGIRKRGNVLLYTAQLPRLVDVIVREMTSVMYLCEYVRVGGFDASRVEVYNQRSVTGSYDRSYAFILPHAPHYPLYNTWDDRVRLTKSGFSSPFDAPVDSPAEPAGSRNKTRNTPPERGSAGAREALPSSVRSLF